MAKQGTDNLYKRGDIWWFSYQKNHQRVRCSTGTGDKRQALEIRNRLLQKVDEEIVQRSLAQPIMSNSQHYFDEVVLRFLQDKTRELKPYTLKIYRNHFKTALVPFFSNLYMEEITRLKLKEYEDYRRLNGCSDGLLRKELGLLQGIFNYALEYGLTEHNPFMSYRFKKHLQDYRPRELFLTPAECQSLVNGCNPYLRRLVIVLLETGMRIHEALTLLFTDIATDSQTNIQYLHLRAENTKSNKDRYIPLTKLAMEQINQQKLEFPVSLYVFTDKQGRYYRGTPKTALNNTLKKLGLSAHIGFHTLRHTFASLKLQGLDIYGKHIKPLRIEVISELLGHADISITRKVYAKFDKQSIITAFLEE